MLKTMGLALLLAAAALAQQQNGRSENDPVYVPRKYVSTEGLNHQADLPKLEAPVAEQTSKWIGIGKEVGAAMKEGLDAVVVEAEKFGTTRVGTFVMVTIAWRAMGQDVVKILVPIVFGLPIFMLGFFVWIWSFHRWFFPKRVLVKQEGKLKEWKVVETEFAKNGRVCCGWAHAGALGVWVIVWAIIIF